MRNGWWIAWVMLGCRQPEDAPVARPWGAPTAETGQPSAARRVEGGCALHAGNALRAWCDLTLDPPGGVRLRVAPDAGGDEAVLDRADVDAAHRVGVAFLAPDATYRWTAERLDDPSISATGTFRTGSLPPEAQESWTTTGVAGASSHLHVGVCEDAPLAVVTRVSDGATVWYERFPDATRFVGLEHTEDDTVLALSMPDVFAERSWMGEALLERSRPQHFEPSIHHDLTRSDGYTYVLNKDIVLLDGVEWLLDGFLIFDAEGTEIARWSLADHWLPTVPHPVHGMDITHANSLQVVDGNVVISLRHLSTVFAVEGDPEAPDFGAIRWRLAGDPSVLAGLGSDFALVDASGQPETFVEQHHATLGPDGLLRLFDNRLEAPSRGLVVRLDPDAGTAVVEVRQELDRWCGYQGGHNLTPAGTSVLACSPSRIITEWDGEEQVWSARGQCATGPSRSVPRMIPVDGGIRLTAAEPPAPGP